jgi:DNA-binding NarL/FixJ family response regulator
MSEVAIGKARLAPERVSVARATRKADRAAPASESGTRVRVFIAAENRLLREALARVIAKCDSNEVAGLSCCGFDAETLVKTESCVLLIASRGNLDEDCAAISRARAHVADLGIVLIGMAKDAEEFLRCIRAGIDGYLLRDASAQEVLEAVRAVHGGDSVCPRSLCSVLFRYVESGAPAANKTCRKRLEIAPAAIDSANRPRTLK